MKILAKYHACNHCVIGENTFKNILIGPGKLPGLSRNGAPGLKTGVENGIFWSEIGSTGFGEPGGTPLPTTTTTTIYLHSHIHRWYCTKKGNK